MQQFDPFRCGSQYFDAFCCCSYKFGLKQSVRPLRPSSAILSCSLVAAVYLPVSSLYNSRSSSRRQAGLQASLKEMKSTRKSAVFFGQCQGAGLALSTLLSSTELARPALEYYTLVQCWSYHAFPASVACRAAHISGVVSANVSLAVYPLRCKGWWALKKFLPGTRITGARSAVSVKPVRQKGHTADNKSNSHRYMMR